MTDNDSIPDALTDRADAIQTALTGDDRGAAEAAARDTLSPGMRKPASDDVENERIRRARAEAPDDEKNGRLFDPNDPRLAPAEEAAESTPL